MNKQLLLSSCFFIIKYIMTNNYIEIVEDNKVRDSTSPLSRAV